MSLIFLSFCRLRVPPQSVFGVHNSRSAGDEQNFGLVIERRVKNFPLNKDEDFSVCSDSRNHQRWIGPRSAELLYGKAESFHLNTAVSFRT